MIVEEFGAVRPEDMAAAALFEFHRANQKYGGPAAKISGTEFVAMVDKDQPNWRRLFGQGLIASELPSGKINSAMQTVANQYRGQIPNRRGFGKFFDAVMGKMTRFDLARDAIVQGATETAKQGADLAVSVGKSAATALKMAPFIYLFGGLVVAYFVFRKKVAPNEP